MLPRPTSATASARQQEPPDCVETNNPSFIEQKLALDQGRRPGRLANPVTEKVDAARRQF
jgi:hypothetical protein